MSNSCRRLIIRLSQLINFSSSFIHKLSMLSSIYVTTFWSYIFMSGSRSLISPLLILSLSMPSTQLFSTFSSIMSSIESMRLLWSWSMSWIYLINLLSTPVIPGYIYILLPLGEPEFWIFVVVLFRLLPVAPPRLVSSLPLKVPIICGAYYAFSSLLSYIILISSSIPPISLNFLRLFSISLCRWSCFENRLF